MEQVRLRREALGLTQHDAAVRAGISVPTWYRIETDSGWSGRGSTVEAVERVLRLPKGGLQALRSGQVMDGIEMETPWPGEWMASFADFEGDPCLTPRQAYKLVMATAPLTDDFMWKELLNGELRIREFRVLRFLPDWVLFMVNDHWLDKLRSSIVGIADVIEAGDMPYPECVADKVAIWLLIKEVRENSPDDDALLVDLDPDGSILPIDADREEYWGSFEATLFNEDLAFTKVWDADFPGLVLGDPTAVVDAEEGLTAGELHPFRWWEPRPWCERE